MRVLWRVCKGKQAHVHYSQCLSLLFIGTVSDVALDILLHIPAQ